MVLCKVCGKEATRRTPWAKYCDYRCQKKWHDGRRRAETKKDPVKLEKYRLYCRNYRRKRAGIDVSLPAMRKPPGTGHLDKNGYVILHRPGHPNCTTKGGKIAQHTFVMSEYLGRPLMKHENVHHKNGIRSDNRIENLELWTRKQLSGGRVEDKIQSCIEFLDTYGFDVVKRI